ncbi:AAA family ATPase [Pseudomonas sp. MDT1-17]
MTIIPGRTEEMNSPSRFVPAPVLFLPLASETAGGLSDAALADNFFKTASTTELAAVLLIQNLNALVQQKVSVTRIEVMYDGALRAGRAPSPADAPSFAAQVQSRFKASIFAHGLTLLPSIGASLLDADEVAKRDYLTSDGNWDFTFGQRYSQKNQPLKREVRLPTGGVLQLSDQQSRLFDEFNACQDESFHIQGYAGTGKTFLIAKFFEYLNPNSTLLMAYMPSQVQALKNRMVQSGVTAELNAHTFGHVANQILNRDKTSLGWRISDSQRSQSTYLVSDQQIANWLNFRAVGSLRPRDVANVCHRAVYSYCLSPSQTIEPRHLPAIGGALNDADIAVLMEYSRLIWSELIWPSAPEIRLPVRNAHRIKFLSLRREVIPEEYTHVIIDESHELSAPMLQILDRSPQAVLTLGDEFQHLHGMTPRHGAVVRQRYVTQSVRAGKEMGEILNPLIQKHPSVIKESYEGRSEHPMQLLPYNNMSIPEKPTTIIVANEWGLMGWFIRLTEAGAKFQMADRAKKELNTFLTDLILLFTEGTRPRHRMIFGYATWDALGSAMGRNYEFKAVQELLDRGFTFNDLAERMKNFCSEDSAKIKLARVDDVKNQEYNTVLLSRDLLRPPREGSTHALATVCSLLYTASSRARHELLLPGNMKDWLTALSQPTD